MPGPAAVAFAVADGLAVRALVRRGPRVAFRRRLLDVGEPRLVTGLAGAVPRATPCCGDHGAPPSSRVKTVCRPLSSIARRVRVVGRRSTSVVPCARAARWASSMAPRPLLST